MEAIAEPTATELHCACCTDHNCYEHLFEGDGMYWVCDQCAESFWYCSHDGCRSFSRDVEDAIEATYGVRRT